MSDKYVLSAVLSSRCRDLFEGAQPLVDYSPGDHYIEIAQREMDAGKLSNYMRNVKYKPLS